MKVRVEPDDSSLGASVSGLDEGTSVGDPTGICAYRHPLSDSTATAAIAVLARRRGIEKEVRVMPVSLGRVAKAF